MKKCLILLLSLLLILTGLFLWKGGHHAIFLSEILEDWLDADSADQTLTLQLSDAGFDTDDAAGLIRPRVDHWSMTADTFWTEYADDTVFGISTGGMTAYLREGILYMDTGRAYALPELSALRSSLGRVAAGLLLHGRITRNGDTYNLTMKTQELELSASVTADRSLQSMALTAAFADGTAVQISLIPRERQSHPIPAPVSDAMVLARMERPESLSEPLSVLIPAMESLLPLSGELELSISSGVLELSETVDLKLTAQTVSVIRSGIRADLPLDLSNLSPGAIGLLALRNGTFSRSGNIASFSLSIPGDAVGRLVTALVPQASGLDITFADSTLALTVSDGRLTGASVTAEGRLPILVASIPLTFTAQLTVK